MADLLPNVVPPDATKLSFPVSDPGTVPTPPAPAASNEFFPTPEELAASQPAAPASGEFFPSPEELKASKPAEFFPLREMSVDELAKMSKDDPSFNPLDEYRKSGGTDNSKLDPELWNRARDTYNKLKQDQSWRDLHPVDMAVNLAKTVPEMGKWIYSLDKSLAYAVNHPEVAAGLAEGLQAQIQNSALAKLPAVAAIQDKLNALKSKEAPKPFSPEVESGYLDLMQERAEAFAGLKSKAVGLGQMVQNFPEILGRKMGILKQAKDFTPEEKDADFRTALAQRKAVETAATSYPTQRTEEILKATGRPLRPEEVSAQAAGEPFSWGAMGGAFGLAGRAATPVLRAAAKLAPESIAPIAPQVLRASAEEGAAAAAAKATARRAAVKAAEDEAADAAASPEAPGFLSRNIPKVTKVLGAVKGGFLGAPSPFGIIAGVKEGAHLGEKVGEKVVSGIEKAGGIAGALQDFGRQVATGEGITSRSAQLLRSGVESLPGIAKQTAGGAAFDAALYSGTVETPEQAKGFIPFGTVLGAAGGAKELGGRVLTGQTIGARKIGDIPAVNSSGLHPELDALHNASMEAGIADDRNFVNGSRALSQGAGAKNDIYFAPPPPAGEADPLVAALTSLKKADGTPALTPEQVNLYAAQNGAHIVNPLGDGRDITIVRNPPSAPHEAAHALEKVLGEKVMQGLRDSIQQKQTDAGNWDAMGQHYSGLVARAAGLPEPGANWREFLLQHATSPRNGETPTQATDRYIASENFAEHVDAMFKHGGGVLNPHQGIADHIWNTIAGTVRAMGGNPIAGAASEVLHFPLDYDYIKQIQGATGKVLPAATPPLKPGKRPLILPRGAIPTNEAQKQEAAKEAQAAVVKATGTPQQGPVTSISDAIRTGGGVKLDTKTETGKDFLPVRIDGGHLIGFDPNIFNQNAHDLARYIADLPQGHPLRTKFETDPELSKFGLNSKDRSFNQAGWDLFNKYADTYAKNQQQGFTGAGQKLVVPENIIAAGQAFKPEETGTPEAIPQTVADLMNHLYSAEGGLGVQKSNIARGKLPGNIRDVAIAEATGGAARVSPLPGREFTGKQAKKLGVEGRPILEVNPLRAEMKKSAPGLPQPKNVLQRLNMAEISKAEPATLPNRVVNTLTTHAGLQPRTPMEIEGPDGKKYRVTHDGFQDMTQFGMGKIPQFTMVDDASAAGGPMAKSTTYGPSLEKKGFKVPPTPEAQFQAPADLKGEEIFDHYTKAAEAAIHGNDFKLAGDFLVEAKKAADFESLLARKSGTLPSTEEKLRVAHREDFQKSELQRLAQTVYEHKNAFLDRSLPQRVFDAGQALESVPPQASLDGTGFKSHADLVDYLTEHPNAAGEFDAPNFWRTSKAYRTVEHPVNPGKAEWDQVAGVADSSDPLGTAEALTDETIKEHPEYDGQSVYDGYVKKIKILERIKNNMRIQNGFFRKRKPFEQVRRPGPLEASFQPTGEESADELARKFAASVYPYEAPKNVESVVPPSRYLTTDKDKLAESRATELRAKERGYTSQFQPKTFIVRHGATEMNDTDPAKDRIRGSIDVPLSPEGKKEARQTALDIAAQGGVDHIITSDLGRAHDTAKEISKTTGATIETDPGLRPWHFGPTIEGQPTTKMLPVIKELVDNPDTRPEGGETFNEFKDRFLGAFKNAQEKTADQNSAIVTHYRGTKLLDAWRDTGVDNDTINKAVFESYDPNKKPGNVDVVNKAGEKISAQFQAKPERTPEEDKKWFTNPAGASNYRMPIPDSGRGLAPRSVTANYWLSPSGNFYDAQGFHWKWAREHITDSFNPLKELQSKGWIRVNADGTEQADGTYIEGPKPNTAQRAALEDLGFHREQPIMDDSGRIAIDSTKEFYRPSAEAQFQPTEQGKLFQSEERERKPKATKSYDDMTEAEQDAAMARADQYYNIGHGVDVETGDEKSNPQDVTWIYDPASRGLRTAPGTQTHGMAFTHEVADRTYKGRYDREKNTVSVAFPGKVRDRMEFEPTVDDIPSGVYNAIQSRFGKTVKMVAFQPKADAQFQGRKSKQDYELKVGPGGFSKAWILPDGRPVQLGQQWHHEYLNEHPEIMEKYGVKPSQSDWDNRGQALRKGFARINYQKNTGALKVEARQQDWPKLRESVREFARVNMAKLDNMDVHLTDAKADRVVEQDGVALHTYDPEERMDHLPLISEPTPTTTMSPQASAGEANFQPKDLVTPEREKQFKASKVRFENGTLKPVFHATVSDFPLSEMETAGFKAHFGTPDQAANRVLGPERARARSALDTGGEGANVHPAFLDIKNPLRMTDVGSWDQAYDVAMELARRGVKLPQRLKQKINDTVSDEANRVIRSAPEGETPLEEDAFNQANANILSELQGEVQKAGYDGVIYKNDFEEPAPEMRFERNKQFLSYEGQSDYYPTDTTADSYIPFDKSQIHSAFDEAPMKFFHSPETKFQPKAEAQFQAPKAEDFKDEAKIGDALKQPGWALFTATQEALGPHTAEVNQTANDNLEKALIADGFNPVEVKGYYKGVDQGKNFLVPGMSQEQAQEWGDKYKQESVLTNKGLIYNDDTVSPVNHDNTVIGKEAKGLDFYSQIPGGPAFSMGIDFGKRIPLNKASQQQQLLGGGAERPALSSKQVGEMGTKALREHYPEAYVPNQVRNKAGELTDPLVPSAITEAPLIKGMDRPEAVKTYAAKLVDEAKKWIKHPNFQAGLKWYSEFTPQLKRVYGKSAQIMAELLAATSPNNAPEINFAFANDALQGYKAGRFDKQIKKFEEGAEKVKDGTWEKWLAKADPQGVQSEANFLNKWIEKYDLRPKQSNGKLYGMHSDAVLQVFARQWLEQTQGPKTQNFVQNLLGTGHEATIDVWADRTMRRLGYQDADPRWRILPKNATGVSDADFAFSQEVFNEAAKQLGVKPDALQGGMWFAEKQHWADNGWGRLDLGDYRKEIAKVPMLESGIQQRLAAQKAQAKIKPMEQQAMFQPKPFGEEIEKQLKRGIDRDEPLEVSIPLSKISIGQKQFAQAEQDNRSGRGSHTEGIPLLNYDPGTGKIVVEDGLHRIAAHKGSTIDAFIHSAHSDYTANAPYKDFSAPLVTPAPRR